MSLFARLGRFTYRRRWPILSFWAVVLVTAAFFAPGLGGQLKGGGFEGSGRDSEVAKNLMVQRFGLPRANLAIVFEGGNLSARSAEYQRAEDEALQPLRNVEGIRSVARLVAAGDVPIESPSPLGADATKTNLDSRLIIPSCVYWSTGKT